MKEAIGGIIMMCLACILGLYTSCYFGLKNGIVGYILGAFVGFSGGYTLSLFMYRMAVWLKNQLIRKI